MSFFAKILADSINTYNNRITTYIIRIPYYYLIEFKKEYINLSYTMTDKLYELKIEDDIQQYYFTTAIEYLNNLTDVPLVKLFNICHVFITSTEWGKFFNEIYNNPAININKKNNKSYYNVDFYNLINNMESLYYANEPTVLGIDDYHLPFFIKSKFTKIEAVKRAFAVYLKFKISMTNSDIMEINTIFAKSYNYGNKSVYNHIAKFPDPYNYFTNGSFNRIWDNKSNCFLDSYDTIFTSYLTLFDICNDAFRNKKLIC